MAYLGNAPARSFISFEKQVFTIVNSQTAYTLSHSVTNENDIRLVINNVVQEPGSGKAYTASGTTLTLSAALVNGTDEMYCVFLGKAVQTVNAPNASVGNSQTAPTIITGQTAETSIATDDTILIHDTSASALRKMTRANFVSGIGGTNTPSFSAVLASNFTMTQNTLVLLPFATEQWDTDNAYTNTSSNYKFTVPSGKAGKYQFNVVVSQGNQPSAKWLYPQIRKNGSSSDFPLSYTFGYTSVTQDGFARLSGVLDLAEADYLQIYCTSNEASNLTLSSDKCIFQVYKLIT